MKNKIICGDCKDILKTIPEGSVDLIYLDPPFSSNKNYTAIWGENGEELTFKDAGWKEGIKGYIHFLKPRLKECHRVLKDTGSIYVHCDWHANAHIRLMLDEIFGVQNFQNGIVWSYKTGGLSSSHFGRKHDTIFFYSKSDNFLFNVQYAGVSEYRTLGMKFDSGGKPYKKTKQGRRYFNEKGPMLTDVWEIPYLSSVSLERTGYPTQKPEKLLERIIKASSNECDLVLDPFCGCGTAISVAAQLKRNFIGIDCYRKAVIVMNKRLKELCESPKSKYLSKEVSIGHFDWEVVMPETLKDIRKYDGIGFQDWVCDKLGAYKGKRGADKGVDGITYHNDTVVHDCVRRGKLVVPEGTVIQCKQSEKKGVVGITQLKKFNSTVEQHNDVGVMIGWDFSKEAREYILEVDEKRKIYLMRTEDLYNLETREGPYRNSYKTLVDKHKRL